MRLGKWQDGAGAGGGGQEGVLRTMMLLDLLKLCVCGCDGLRFPCPQLVCLPSAAPGSIFDKVGYVH